MGTWLQLKAEDGHSLAGYEAKPEGDPKGALVIVQEIFGVNAHIRSVVDGYARDGYVALAPALFDRIEPGVELRYEGEDMQRAVALYQKLDPESSVLDVAAAFKYLEGDALKVGVVGYCFGGFMSWLSATRGPSHGFTPQACVGYYPGGIGRVAKEEPCCPVMLHFGAEDTHIGVDQIDAVRDAHPDVQIFMYEGAGHGFNCDARSSFDPQAAALAKQRTLKFLQENLS